MCSPTYFDVEYAINPWMHLGEHPDLELAQQEWRNLNRIYRELEFDIEQNDPVNHLPDMVFTANGGLVIDGKVMLPRFKYKERRPETEHFKRWFEQNGYLNVKMPEHIFEGEGDALVCNGLILAGYGFRSDLKAHAELSVFFDKKVISLNLVNPLFYHLDTALTVLDSETVMFWPGAFDQESRFKIQGAIPNVIEASEADAMAFGLNAVSDGHNVVMSAKAKELIAVLKKRGFNPIGTDISEFQKSGGGIKCLTLELR